MTKKTAKKAAKKKTKKKVAKKLSPELQEAVDEFRSKKDRATVVVGRQLCCPSDEVAKLILLGRRLADAVTK